MHMMLEMEYVFSLLSNLEVHYILCCLQICFRIGVSPPDRCTNYRKTIFGHVENGRSRTSRGNIWHTSLNTIRIVAMKH